MVADREPTSIIGETAQTLDGALLAVRIVPGLRMAVVGSPRDAVLVAPLVDAPLLDSDNPRLAVKELGGTSRTHEAIAAVRPFRIDVQQRAHRR